MILSAAAAFAQSGSGGTAGSPADPSGDRSRPGVGGSRAAPPESRDETASPSGRTASDPQKSLTADERSKCGSLSGIAQENCVRDLRARPDSGPAMGKDSRGSPGSVPRSTN
jgi:hypothetical protein